MLNLNDANEELRIKISDINKKIDDVNDKNICNNTCNKMENDNAKTNGMLNVDDSIKINNSFDALSTLFQEEIATPGTVKKHIEKFNNESISLKQDETEDKSNENDVMKSIDDTSFITIESKSARRRRISDERMKRAVVNLQGAPPPVRYIFISRVAEGNEKIIIDYLKYNSIKVTNIDCISHCNAKFKSFKVAIFKNDISKVLNEGFWPMGIQCKLWREHNSKNIEKKPYKNEKTLSTQMFERRESKSIDEKNFYNRHFINKNINHFKL